MKKILIFLTLGGFLVMGGSMTFAADAPELSRGNGLMLHAQVSSPSEALQIKIEKIDNLVTEGRITAEKAVEFKTALTERMSNCDGTQNRDSKERLGIGFGRTADKGQFKGLKR